MSEPRRGLGDGPGPPGAAEDAGEDLGDLTTPPVASVPPPRSMAANIGSLATSQAVTWTMAIVWTFVVPRLIGPQDLGLLVIATSVTAVVGVALGLTPREFLVREMVARPGGATRLLSTALTLRVGAIPVMFLCAAIYGRVAQLDQRAMQVMFLIAGATACTLLLEPAISVFQSRERMQFIAYTDMGSKTLQTVGGVLLAIAGFGVVAIAGFSFLTAVLILVLALVWAHRIIGRPQRPLPVAPVVRQAFPYWFVAVFFVGYLWADGFMLGILVPTEVVGWYGAATRLFTTMMFVAVIISTASLPRLIAAYTRDPVELYETARTPFEWVLMLGLPLGVGMACIADEVIPFLYGGEYTGSVVPLTILGLCLPWMYVNIMVNQVFIASGRPMMTARLLAAAAAVNVGLNVVLIPLTQERLGNGAIGAATSLLVTELVQMAMGLALIGRQLLRRSTVVRVSSAAAAAAVMALVLVVLDGVPFPIQIAVGAGVYLALLILLRVPTTAERAFVRSQISRRLAKRRSARFGGAGE